MLSVQDADAAVSWGPGLRWGVMGPNLLWHIGGGEGGIHHFMELGEILMRPHSSATANRTSLKLIVRLEFLHSLS